MTQLLEKISLSFLSHYTNTQYSLEKTSKAIINKLIKNSNGIYSIIGEIKDIHITQTKQVLVLIDWADGQQLESTGEYFSYLDALAKLAVFSGLILALPPVCEMAYRYYQEI